MRGNINYRMLKCFKRVFLLMTTYFLFVLGQDDEFCLHETGSRVGGKVTLKCINEEEFTAHLKNVKYEWIGESVPVYPPECSRERLIVNAHPNTAGAFECRVSGTNDDGTEEILSFYHYVMPEVTPTFFAANRATFSVKKCNQYFVKYAQGRFANLATPANLCRGSTAVPVCRLKAAIKCENNRFTIDFKSIQLAIGGHYVHRLAERKGMHQTDLLNTIVYKTKTGIKQWIGFDATLMSYLQNGIFQQGFGFECKGSTFAQEGETMSFDDALKFGVKAMRFRFCFPCPAGTYGNAGKCHPCKPSFFNDRLGQKNCVSCPGMTKYYGAKQKEECYANNEEKPEPEFANACSASKLFKKKDN